MKTTSLQRLLARSILACGLVSQAACSSTDDAPNAADAGVPGVDEGGASAAESGEAGEPNLADGGEGGEPDGAEAGAGSEAAADGEVSGVDTVLNLDDVKTNPANYTWFDFRPNIKKLILAGAAETEHIAILWYTITEGSVALHYHAKTESVYVIDGTQTDGKGVYPTGTVYFNPPGSGHEVTHSSGFFLLAYAAPPDFARTDLIGDYTPIRIDTGADDLTTAYPFEHTTPGIGLFSVPVDPSGGLSAQLIDTTSLAPIAYSGNYVVVLKGHCDIQGSTYGKDMLVVGKAVAPHAYAIAASSGSSCLAMGLSF